MSLEAVIKVKKASYADLPLACTELTGTLLGRGACNAVYCSELLFPGVTLPRWDKGDVPECKNQSQSCRAYGGLTQDGLKVQWTASSRDS